LIEFVIL